MNIIEIERAILKRYRAKLYRPFVKAVNDYDLVKSGDKIAVCMSGGKDSFVLAKLFQEMKRHGKIDFDVKFLVMNPGFNEINLLTLKKNAEILGIPIIIKDSDIFRVAYEYGKGQPCYLCAKMRRGFLYDFAKEQGCNKIALGHHFDDIIETTLLNVLYSGTFKTMPPKLKSTNHPGMELIRPMAYVHEKDIINYMNFCGIQAMNCGCAIASGELPSKRRMIKNLIKELKKDYKDIDKNIFSSAENVNLNCVLGWTKGETKHTFLEDYDKNDYIEEDE